MARRSRGQLVSYKRSDGSVRWSARYVDADGSRVQELLDGYDLTRRDARDRLEELLVAVRKEHRRKHQPMTLEQFAAEWIDELDELDKLKRSTRRGYRLIIESHLLNSDLARRQLGAIRGHDVAGYVRAKQKAGLGEATINRHLNLLHKLYDDARRQRGIETANRWTT